MSSPDAPADPPETAARDRILSTFHAEYHRLNQSITLGELEQKFLNGVAFWDDLQLEGSLHLVERLSDEQWGQLTAVKKLILTSEFQRLLDALCTLTMEDTTTGLFNRRYFDNRIFQELQRALRDSACCSLAMLDIDHFKQVNDTHGHQVGDEMLAHVAQLMGSTLRTSDVTARFGGEEFTIILPSTDARAALTTAERIREVVADSPLQLPNGEQVRVTVSIGLSTFEPSTMITPDQLLRQADAAMYRAKQGGRNQVKFHGDLPTDTPGVSAEEKAALFK